MTMTNNFSNWNITLLHWQTIIVIVMNEFCLKVRWLKGEQGEGHTMCKKFSFKSNILIVHSRRILFSVTKCYPQSNPAIGFCPKQGY